LFLFRPIVMLPPAGPRDTIVPVLVDVSRSMRLGDADGQTRVARANALLKTLLPALKSHASPELFAVGDGIRPASIDGLAADARRSDLGGALAAVRERYRGQRLAGVVLISDGGDTGAGGAGGVGRAGGSGGLPVFAIGVGSPDGPKDREVRGITAGDPRLDQSSVDLHVTAVSNGFGRAPFMLRVLANGRVLDSRRIVPQADGSPIDAMFTVSPDPLTATVYTAEIPNDEAEAVTENNARSVLVSPPGRKRRVLVLEGAPGFEHSFMTRAWAADSGLEIDSVTRKGKNADGQDTFFVQAGPGRSAALTSGFPQKREQLYAYDALVIANVEADFFTRAQLAMAADFVSERGGGLLVLGGRSFSQRGLAGTPLEDVLPVELNDRRGGLMRASLGAGDLPVHNKLRLTSEGETHPIMRIGSTADETRKLWSALPALAASAALGGPRPGATVLALTTAPGGGVYPVVAVQRYGQGRSMVFAGEASWRWKMMVASSDRSYDFFWRQAVRWLSSPAPDPVAIAAPVAPEPGDALPVDIDARDAAFQPVADATVDATVTLPGGETRPIKLRHPDAASGRFTASIGADQPGLYQIHAAARRGTTPLGTADRWIYVGGADREFADPRLNEGFLRRIARDSGGRYVRAADASKVPEWLQQVAPQNAAPEQRDLWHEPWAFALIVILLSGEWILRRRWGLR
jgi:Putative glutamine amidotransferase